MNDIMIFSGTTEGRSLSEGLADRGVPHTVFVATEYGEMMMHDDPLVEVRRGRLDEAEMRSLFIKAGKGLRVYDATHPFAQEVTANIRRACEAAGAQYIRVLRDAGIDRSDKRYYQYDLSGSGSSGGAASSGGQKSSEVRVFRDVKSCAEALADVPGNILLTTGSKELAVFAGVPGLSERIFARVLPTQESIALCSASGIEGRQVIAMHGPFSLELNKALIEQYDIDILVTKETGHIGGYPDKLMACAQCGIKAFVIGKPNETEGISVEEALEPYAPRAGSRLDPAAAGEIGEAARATGGAAEPAEAVPDTGEAAAAVEAGEISFVWDDEPCDLISLIGIGPGAPGLLTREAAERIVKADVVFGAPRMLESAGAAHDPAQAGAASQAGAANDPSQAGAASFPYYLVRDVLPVILERAKSSAGPSRYAVLFSGDSGFFSGAKKMKAGLEEGLAEAGVDFEIEILPGISSLSLLAARLGVDYSDAALRSLHGSKDPGRAVEALIGDLERYGKVFTLLSGKDDIPMLADKLKGLGQDKASLFVGKDLSYPDEAVFMVDVDTGRLIPDLPGCDSAELLPTGSYAAYLCAPKACGKPVFPILGDDEFERGKVPMTKESIRHLSIARLKLSSDSVLYDVGSGTGSIAVQAALLGDGIRVYAIEKKPEALELIRLNAEKHRRANVVTVEGTAPEALIGLEVPTHAFIGGSSGNLREILEVIRSKNPKARIVMNAVSLETIAEMTSVVKEFPVEDLTIEQIQSSRSRSLGSYHLMTADNPVMICSFNFAEPEE